MTDIEPWREQLERTTYFFDVGTEEEYEASNPTGFRPAPGGQLVQETEMLAPVRGARIVLVDSDSVRANMSAPWLAQMAWDVFVLDGISAHDFAESAPWPAALPPTPAVDFISARELAQLLEEGSPPAILDQTTSLNYQRGQTALRFGLVNELVAGDEVARKTLELAHKIAAKSALTVAIGKTAYYRQAELPLSEAYAYTQEVMVNNLDARDAQEGINAFIDKREPVWCGR